jgi:hypothetical protein
VCAWRFRFLCISICILVRHVQQDVWTSWGYVIRLIFDDLDISTFGFSSPVTSCVVQETSSSAVWNLVHLTIIFRAIIAFLESASHKRNTVIARTVTRLVSDWLQLFRFAHIVSLGMRRNLCMKEQNSGNRAILSSAPYFKLCFVIRNIN